MCASRAAISSGDAGALLGARLVALALLMSLMAIATAFGQSTPAEPRRVALVIGNGAYPQSPVASAPADARAFADVLREGGFDVVYAENARRAEMEAALGAFTQKLGWGVTAMVYFGGHAIRYQDRNFLLAVNSKIVNEADIRAEGIDIDLLLDPLIVSRPAGAVVILDAARKNPWQQALSPRLRGLTSQPPISGVTVVYPVAPGEVVGDTPREANLFAVELGSRQKFRDCPSRKCSGGFEHPSPRPRATGRLSGNPRRAQSSSSVRCANRFAPPIRSNKASGTRSRAATARPISRPISIPIPMDPLPLRRARVSSRSKPETSRKPAPRRLLPRRRQPHHKLPSATVHNVPKLCSYSPAPSRWDRPRCSISRLLFIRSQFESRSTSAAAKSPSMNGTLVSPKAVASKSPRPRPRAQPAAGHGSGLGRRQELSRMAVAEDREDYRLPSESEWEFVARAGTTTTYPWGRTVEKDKANCLGCTSDPVKKAIDTGSFPPNAFGVYDMAGNAAESGRRLLERQLPGCTDRRICVDKATMPRARAPRWFLQ